MATAPRKSVKPEPDPEDAPPVDKVEPEPEGEPAAEESGKIGLLNPGTTSIVYSADGRSIGGGERAEVDEVDEVGQAAIDRGYLMRTESNS
jgi:hypothetical protein